MLALTFVVTSKNSVTYIYTYELYFVISTGTGDNNVWQNTNIFFKSKLPVVPHSWITRLGFYSEDFHWLTWNLIQSR